jgi:RimJ/RimL family protein N-acetyltransferase
MIGQPELAIQHEGAVNAGGTRELWLGALDFAHAPDELPDEAVEFLSEESTNFVNELLRGQQEGRRHAWLDEASNHLAWGVQQQTEIQRRCVGLVGFKGIPSVPPYTNIKQAESYITLWSDFGQGIGGLAYERMCAFGLAAGIDVIFASVNNENCRSVALHRSCGFVALGTYDRNDQTRLDLRLYNPDLSDTSVHFLQRSTIIRNNYEGPDPAEERRAREIAAGMRTRHADLDAVVQTHPSIVRRFKEGMRPEPYQA